MRAVSPGLLRYRVLTGKPGVFKIRRKSILSSRLTQTLQGKNGPTLREGQKENIFKATTNSILASHDKSAKLTYEDLAALAADEADPVPPKSDDAASKTSSDNDTDHDDDFNNLSSMLSSVFTSSSSAKATNAKGSSAPTKRKKPAADLVKPAATPQTKRRKATQTSASSPAPCTPIVASPSVPTPTPAVSPEGTIDLDDERPATKVLRGEARAEEDEREFREWTSKLELFKTFNGNPIGDSETDDETKALAFLKERSGDCTKLLRLVKSKQRTRKKNP